jgi:ribosomal protein S18 acetylase RimI-like enzyme
MSEVYIRKASEDDLKTIHDMAQVVFRHTYREILSPDQMEYMMDMMYSMPNLRIQLQEGHHYYIAYEGPEPCGYVSVQHEGPDDDGVEVFHLHKIYVMPDVQGRGVGLKLFETVTGHVRNAVPGRKARIELNVNKYNKAVTFYKHLGMRVLLEEDFPIGNGFYKTDFIMGLDINTVKNI